MWDKHNRKHVLEGLSSRATRKQAKPASPTVKSFLAFTHCFLVSFPKHSKPNSPAAIKRTTAGVYHDLKWTPCSVSEKRHDPCNWKWGCTIVLSAQRTCSETAIPCSFTKHNLAPKQESLKLEVTKLQEHVSTSIYITP